MMVFLNGSFVPEEKALIPVFDRGFLYGDGLFETVRVCNGNPYRWEDHLERFKSGAALLGIPLPAGMNLAGLARELVQMNSMPECLLRLALSRGTGKRGYSPEGANSPTLLLSLHSLTEKADELKCWRLVTARMPAADPLGSVKTSSKIVQVLARAEAAGAGADDAILVDASGHAAETTSSNLFWISQGAVRTVPLSRHILPGITRKAILELCHVQGIPAHEEPATTTRLASAEGVFLTQTTLGVVEVEMLDGQPLARSALTRRLHRMLFEEMRRI